MSVRDRLRKKQQSKYDENYQAHIEIDFMLPRRDGMFPPCSLPIDDEGVYAHIEAVLTPSVQFDASKVIIIHKT